MGLAWGIGGLLVGLIAGSLITWSVMRQPPPRSGEVAAKRPAGGSGGHIHQPDDTVQDSEVKKVLDANQRTLAELEDRYRDRKPPKGRG